MVLEYDEGQPIPDGYRVDSRVSRPLLGAGAGVFGGFWFLSFVVGLSGDENTYYGDGGWGALYVPLAGPFIAIGTLDASDGGLAILLVDGFAQLGGATMFALSFILPQKRLVRENLHLSLTPEITVAPVFTGKGFGLTGTF